MIKKTLMATALALPLVACNYTPPPHPCSQLTVSAKDREAIANGYEVEREGLRGKECELTPSGTWEIDQ
jgi:hypothetical protein